MNSMARLIRTPFPTWTSSLELPNVKFPMTGMMALLIHIFCLCLRGEAEKWLASTARHLELTPAQKTWTRI